MAGKADPPVAELSIGKAWQGIHFLLNGTSWEMTCVAGQAVLGGQAAGWDGSYGPVRYMTPGQVREVSQAMEAVTREQFAAGYDPARMNRERVYPSGAWGRAYDVPWLWGAFCQMRDFFRDSAFVGDALLFEIA